jgi:hypothetical protein
MYFPGKISHFLENGRIWMIIHIFKVFSNTICLAYIPEKVMICEMIFREDRKIINWQFWRTHTYIIYILTLVEGVMVDYQTKKTNITWDKLEALVCIFPVKLAIFEKMVESEWLFIFSKYFQIQFAWPTFQKRSWSVMTITSTNRKGKNASELW